MLSGPDGAPSQKVPAPHATDHRRGRCCYFTLLSRVQYDTVLTEALARSFAVANSAPKPPGTGLFRSRRDNNASRRHTHGSLYL